MHSAGLKDSDAHGTLPNTKEMAVFSYLFLGVFALFVLLAVRYQYYLLDYLTFGDEAETVVAAKMMVSGQKLYSEIFNHHGPLTFLTGYIIESFGSYSVPGHRVPIAILQILAMVAVYFSPLLHGRDVKKAYVIFAGAVMLLYYSENFGSMYMYQVLAGLLLVVILAQYSLPAIAAPKVLGRNWVFFGNLLIACLPFLAVTYVPIAALLFIACLRVSYWKCASVGFAIGVLLNVAFLMGTGSLAGYFAYHIYLNSQVLSLYNGGQNGFNLILTAFYAGTANLANFTVFAVVVFSVVRLAAEDSRVPWRSILLGLAAASLLIRGLGFHGLPFYYVALIVPVVFFNGSFRLSFQSNLILLSMLLVCVYKLSLLFPGDMQKILSKKNPATTEFSLLVDKFTEEGDRVIAYSFNNHEYLASGRLPASGYYFYLPWQEKYNESPRYGVKINACQQISESRPKIMLINKWKVWGKYPWESYAGCVQSLVDRDYVQLSGKPYYVRRDIYEKFIRKGRQGFEAQGHGVEVFLHDVVKAADGLYKISGSDPYVVYSLSSGVGVKSASYLAFDLKCTDSSAVRNIPMQVFWRGKDSGFSPQNSFTFDIAQGSTVLDLSKIMRGEQVAALKEVRFDFPDARVCAVAALKQVEVGKMVDGL